MFFGIRFEGSRFSPYCSQYHDNFSRNSILLENTSEHLYDQPPHSPGHFTLPHVARLMTFDCTIHTYTYTHTNTHTHTHTRTHAHKHTHTHEHAHTHTYTHTYVRRTRTHARIRILLLIIKFKLNITN